MKTPLPSLFVHAVAVCAPGLPDWATAETVLRDGAPYCPGPLPPLTVAGLPGNEQRRVSPGIRLALHVAGRATARIVTGGGHTRLRGVFAASSGDADALVAVLAAVTAPDRAVSPRQFSQMDHSAAAGYWSIARGAGGQPSVGVSLGAFDGSFSAGLIEAAAASAEDPFILLVSCDGQPPPPLRRFRVVPMGFAAAILLGVSRPEWGGCAWTCRLTAGEDEDRCVDPALERLRASNPAARCLPLLQRLARGGDGAAVLPYLPGAPLRVEQSAC